MRRQAFAEFLVSFTTRDELIQQLDKANLAWGSIFNTDEYLQTSKTLEHRNSILQIDDRQGGERPTFQSPYRFSDAKTGVTTGAPHLGEHNDEILAEMGRSPEQIAELRASDVIG